LDEGKTEAVLFRKGREEMPARKIRVGNHQVAYNKEATRWLGVYLDSSLTLKEHTTGHGCGKPDRPKAGYAVSLVSLD